MAANSRMEAGRWVIIIFIYMVLLTFVMTLFNSFASSYSVTYNTSVSGGYSGTTAYLQNQTCILPSDVSGYFTDSSIQKDTYVTRTTTQYSKCNNMILWGSENSIDIEVDICNNVDGCTYLFNQTKYILGIPLWTTSYCNGTIDYSVYGINTSNWNRENKTQSFCTNDGIRNNRLACESYGCVWVDPNRKSVQSTSTFFSNIIATISDMFTFNIDIGLTEIWLVLFITLFLYVPIFMLLLATYVLIFG
jgi:hypothetical protein